MKGRVLMFVAINFFKSWLSLYIYVKADMLNSLAWMVLKLGFQTAFIHSFHLIHDIIIIICYLLKITTLFIISRCAILLKQNIFVKSVLYLAHSNQNFRKIENVKIPFSISILVFSFVLKINKRKVKKVHS